MMSLEKPEFHSASPMKMKTYPNTSFLAVLVHSLFLILSRARKEQTILNSLLLHTNDEENSNIIRNSNSLLHYSPSQDRLSNRVRVQVVCIHVEELFRVRNYDREDSHKSLSVVVRLSKAGRDSRTSIADRCVIDERY